MSSLSEKMVRGREPVFVRIISWCVAKIESLHAFLAKYLPMAIGWVWRKQNMVPLKIRFAIASFGLSVMAVCAALLIPNGYIIWQDFAPEFVRYIEVAGELSSGNTIHWVAFVSAFLSLVAAGMSFVRKPVGLWVIKAAWALHATLLYLVVRWLFVVPSVLNGADYKAFDNLMRNDLWAYPLFLGPFFAIWPAVMLVAVLTVGARAYYRQQPSKHSIVSNPLINNLRTGGSDPRFRSSIYWTLSLFLAILIVPFIITSCGTEEYGIVKGSGETAVQVAVKKIKPKKKPKKRLHVDPYSPYILERMDIDDIKIIDDLTEETKDVYVADQTSGKLGKGGKGKGGWPKGMEGAKVRFLRLKYNGGNWDQEMGKQGDYNLLVRFSQMTGLPVANETESREIERLAHFAKKKAPPFVFMTGSGNISISASEAKIIRDYCEKEGGMLFIDCGGGNFGASVRRMLAKVFPGKSLVDIPNDDPIYQTPYIFPDGAPRFWHHDGNRALGIRHEGRLMVFYHPGDVKDAWKDGHSGASPEVAEQAYKLGVNVIYYAFNNYYRRHYEQDTE